MTPGERSVRRRIRTDPRARDRALRGRTYAIAFDAVWQAAVALADRGLPRWRLLMADDQRGVLEAEATWALFRSVGKVQVVIGLDANGQTRVDVEATSANPLDLGTGRRRVRRFLLALDQKVGATPTHILDASREPSFTT